MQDATVQAAHQRLDAILTAMRDIGLPADGKLGDYRPLRALAAAVQASSRTNW